MHCLPNLYLAKLIFRIYFKKAMDGFCTREESMMGLLKSILGAFSNAAKDEVSRIIESGSDEDLEHAYEKRRLEWLANGQNGTGEKTADMKRLDREMSRRAAEKWENDPRRNRDPNYRWTDANRWDKD